MPTSLASSTGTTTKSVGHGFPVLDKEMGRVKCNMLDPCSQTTGKANPTGSKKGVRSLWTRPVQVYKNMESSRDLNDNDNILFTPQLQNIYIYLTLFTNTRKLGASLL